MAEIRIAPASADRFDDAEHALTGGGDGASCWCQWWMLRNKDFQATSSEQRRDLLREDLDAPVPSALIAYVDGAAAGWVKVSPRPEQPRLAATRDFQKSPEPWGDASVWAITCFVVRREFRGKGLAGQLLDAAVDHARANGARVIEGYPSTRPRRRPPPTTSTTALCRASRPRASRRSPAPSPHGPSSR